MQVCSDCTIATADNVCGIDVRIARPVNVTCDALGGCLRRVVIASCSLLWQSSSHVAFLPLCCNATVYARADDARV